LFIKAYYEETFIVSGYRLADRPIGKDKSRDIPFPVFVSFRLKFTSQPFGIFETVAQEIIINTGFIMAFELW
jgi:hypothetical protein